MPHRRIYVSLESTSSSTTPLESVTKLTIEEKGFSRISSGPAYITGKKWLKRGKNEESIIMKKSYQRRRRLCIIFCSSIWKEA